MNHQVQHEAHLQAGPGWRQLLQAKNTDGLGAASAGTELIALPHRVLRLGCAGLWPVQARAGGLKTGLTRTE